MYRKMSSDGKEEEARPKKAQRRITERAIFGQQRENRLVAKSLKVNNRRLQGQTEEAGHEVRRGDATGRSRRDG